MHAFCLDQLIDDIVWKDVQKSFLIALLAVGRWILTRNGHLYIGELLEGGPGFYLRFVNIQQDG